MELKDKIINVSPRENSGSIASNRFDYQKDWALCKILELHKERNDYLVTLEFHDDIIVFDSSSEPQKVSFYQVKTRKGNWTINELTKRKTGTTGPLNSIIGKLYVHWENFKGDAESINFVSNSILKVKLKDRSSKSEDKRVICCQEIAQKEIEKIKNKLVEEFEELKPFLIDAFNDVFLFKMHVLDINHHSEIAKGKLTDFIESYLPGLKYRPGVLYKAIFDEIRKKSNYEDHPKSFEELKQKKSISKMDFDKYLLELRKGASFKDFGKQIENRLNAEGCPITFVLKFNKLWDRLEIDRMNYNDKVFQYLIKKTKDIVLKVKKNGYLELKLIDLVEMLFDEVNTTCLLKSRFEKDYLKTIILWVLYETE